WDSSKSTPHATILAAAGLRPVLVLLTRDPADVAFSWARPKARVEADGRPMPRHGWLASGARWDFAVISALIEARRRRRPLVHVTYENLVDGGTPPDAIAAHFRRSNTPPSPEWLHAIGGNPARWTSANGPMVRDSRRHQEQSGAVTMAARLAALPGLLALAAGYGLGWVDKVSPGYRTTPDRDPFVTSPEARAPAATPPPPDRD
ncbi:MAG: hypothetical protein OER95_17080, partial [Acidimicrobiia bacterium]|nr:hypothetical protein [Acidimicrobiia bacterium]